MTTLREPFDNVRKKDIKNKQGQVVAQVDYIEWAAAADRLDEVGEPWSFSVLQLGPDWAHGRLTLGDRHFENVGYAENADMDWKKEPLKDAVSDAFKRCAALAGVARYLYNHSAPARPRSNVPQSPGRATVSSPTARPARSLTTVPEPDDDTPDEPGWLKDAPAGATSASNGHSWTFGALAKAAEDAGLTKTDIYRMSDKLFGKGAKVTDLEPGQREQIAFELGLVG